MYDLKPVDAPYPGLRPFEPHESEIFFGREGHTDRLLEILQREHFLAVIGPSGGGKSSLVRAGLLPGLASGALGTGSHWRLALFRPGAQPVLALAQALLAPHALGQELLGKAQEPATPDDISVEAALLADQLRRGTRSLSQLLATANASHGDEAEPLNLLVLADQFEEIYTYAKSGVGDTDDGKALVDLLLAERADKAGRVYVALTMRTDFLGHCVQFLELPDAINRAQYLTPRLGERDMALAIAGPARVFGGEVAPELVDSLIKQLGQDGDQLPILQHGLARMWRVAKGKNADAPFIDGHCVQQVAMATSALNAHAEEVYTELEEQGHAGAAECLFRAITERREAGGQEVRRPQTLRAIADWAGLTTEALQPVIAAFAHPEVSFLHHGKTLTDKSVIDISHEALIRQWQRLQAWVISEYQRGQAYKRWSKRAEEREVEGLLKGGELTRALEWWNPRDDDEPNGDTEATGRVGKLHLPTEQAQDTLAATQNWQPNFAWAQRYSQSEDPFVTSAEFDYTRQFLMDSREAEKLERDAEQRRLEQEALEEKQRADYQKSLTERAEEAERRLTLSLFESQLTHGSLLARVNDFAEARRVLAESTQLDADIPPDRRHARNLLAGYVEMMGGQADRVYEGAGAALTGGAKLSPDGKLLAAAGELGTLVLFDADSGRLLKRLEGHDPNIPNTNSSVRSPTFDPYGRWLYSGGDDGRIIRWALPDGLKDREWQAPDRVYVLAISPDGKTLASGGPDETITLWSLPDGCKLKTLTGHNDAVVNPNGLSFSPSGEHLASASFDKTARVWDWREGKTALILEGHTYAVVAAIFSLDGTQLATASDDHSVILWDSTNGQKQRVLSGHQNIVFGLAYSEDGRQIYSAAHDNTLRAWDVVSGTTRRVYQGHMAGLWTVARQGEWIYTASDDGTVRRWATATPKQWVWETGDSPQAAALAPDGQTVAVGMNNGALRVYGLPGGRLLAEQTYAHGNSDVNRITYDGTGKLLATAGSDNVAKLWRISEDGKTLSLLHTLEGHSDLVHAVAFSPHNQTVATASYDGHIGLFKATDGQGKVFPAHEGKVASIAYTPDGLQLLSAGNEDRRLRLWSAANPNQPPREITTAQDKLQWACLSPDGRQLAAVGRELVVSLYNLANPATPQRLVGHEQTVYRAIYSPDGHQLATVSSDMTVRLWDVDSQKQLFAIRLPERPQSAGPWDFDFRCTPDGDCWIVVPLTVGRIAVYRLPYAHFPDAKM